MKTFTLAKNYLKSIFSEAFLKETLFYYTDRHGQILKVERKIIKDKILRRSDIPSKENLSEVIIGSTVLEIDACAFSEFYDLKKVTLNNNLSKIGISAFDGCMNLKEIVIPKSVVEIEKAAFASCMNLKEVKIPNGDIKEIKPFTFANCTSLEYVSIPKQINKIGVDAFYSCPNLKNVVFKGKTENQIRNMENFPWCIHIPFDPFNKGHITTEK